MKVRTGVLGNQHRIVVGMPEGERRESGQEKKEKESSMMGEKAGAGTMGWNSKWRIEHLSSGKELIRWYCTRVHPRRSFWMRRQ